MAITEPDRLGLYPLQHRANHLVAHGHEPCARLWLEPWLIVTLSEDIVVMEHSRNREETVEFDHMFCRITRMKKWYM
jgi:hypothetical protein